MQSNPNMEAPTRNSGGVIRHQDPFAVKLLLILLTLLFFTGFVFLPLALVFAEGFRKGVSVYIESIREPYALAAVRLTLMTAAIVVPLNAIFGIAAAWAVSKFSFRGKAFLVSLLDLPFAVSPVIAGLIFVLLLGSRTAFGSWLGDHGIKLIFSTPGIVIATLFVTFPFVARELIPLMESQGREEEEAAVTLGARGWQVFSIVTLPNIRWGLLYGMILCMARSIGEFGAVSVVSGHIRGMTNTVPLHVEILYNEYNYAAAFAVASILVFLALATVTVKSLMERAVKSQQQNHS
jgi:sulfate/thiosulfate transport system permease protein